MTRPLQRSPQSYGKNPSNTKIPLIEVKQYNLRTRMDPLINTHSLVCMVMDHSFIISNKVPYFKERGGQFRKRISTSTKSKVIKTSVTGEGHGAAQTKRQGVERWRDTWGQGRGLSLIKQWLILRGGGGGVAHSGLRSHVTHQLRWSGSQRGSSFCR